MVPGPGILVLISLVEQWHGDLGREFSIHHVRPEDDRTTVIAAAREVSLSVPLVVRLEGTNVELGKKLLADSGLAIVSADSLADAAEKVVTVVREAA